MPGQLCTVTSLHNFAAALPPGHWQGRRRGAAASQSARPSPGPVAGCHGASAAAVDRLAGRHTECEKVYSAGQKRNLNLKYGAINRGDMYEIRVSLSDCQSGVDAHFQCSSSDAKVMCTKMGAHPIISESTRVFVS